MTRERLALSLAIAAIVTACLYPGVTSFLRCQIPPGSIKCYVVTKPRLFDSAQVVSRKLEYISIDPYEYVHLKVPVSQAQAMVKGNILKACQNDRRNCTDPIWLNAEQTKAKPFIGNAGYYTPTVFCTAHWREISAVSNNYPNYRDDICVDTFTGDVWYSYNEI